jgi:flagellar export protein FliJ
MARRFVFALDAVLAQRVRAEREAQVSLASAERARAGALTHLAAANELYGRARRTAWTLSTDGFDLTMQEIALHFIDAARRGVSHAESRVAAAEKECVAARLALVEAARARQGLERLRARKEQEFHRALAQRDERTVDDLIGTRYRGTADVVS